MPIELGVARGYLELDLKDFDTAVASAEKGLKAIERGGKLTESEMRLLSSSAANTGGVFQQAAAKSQTLASQIDSAKQKSQLYRSEIEGLNKIIIQSSDEQKKLTGKIMETSNKYEKAQEVSKEMAAAYRDVKKEQDSLQKTADKYKETLGEESEEYKKAKQAADEHAKSVDEAAQNYEKAQGKSDSYRNNLKQLEEKHGDLSLEIEHSKDKVTEFQTGLNNAEADIKDLTRELENSENKVRLLGQTFVNAGDRIYSAGEKISAVGGALTLGVTTPLLAAGTMAAKSAIDFESAFAGVKKTVDASDQELRILKQGIIDMSLELPAAATEISGVAEAAGQLGIQKDSILDFSKVMIDMGESTNLGADEAATTLARFANITGMSQKDFSRLGSVIVDLGNNLATTESEIAAMGLRLAGAGSQVGMSEAQILSLSGALSSVGIEAEAGGSAFSKVLIDMQLAVETGTESMAQLQTLAESNGISWDGLVSAMRNGGSELKSVAGQMGLTNKELRSMYDEAIKSAGSLEDFASVAGMSSEDFTKAFKEDAAGALMKFVEGLSTAEERGISAIKVLDDMDITEVRMRDSLLRASGASEVFSKSLEIGSNAWEENNALTKEASQRYETTESKIQIAKNGIVEAARSIGANMLPTIADLAKSAADLTKQFANLPPETQKTIITFAGIAAAAGPVLKVTGGITQSLGKLTGGIGKLLSTAKSVKKPLEGVSDAVGGVAQNAASASGGIGSIKGILSSLIGPAGIAALAAGALIGIGTACYLAYQEAKKNDLAEHFGNVKLSAEEVEDVAKRLTTTDWTVRLDAYMEAQTKLEEFEQNLQSTVEELNKLDWKISVGLELTDTEKENYRQATSDFVTQCQNYIEQQNYTMDLAIKASFSVGSTTGAGLSAFINSYYSSSQGELEDLGIRLADLINDSFENNAFAKNRIEMEKIRQRMSEIVQEMAHYQEQASNTQFVMSLNNMDVRMDAESFQKVNEKINEQVKEIAKSAEAANKDTLVAIEMQYDALIKAGVSKDVADKFKEQAIQELQTDLANSESEVRLEGINFSLDTLKSNYKNKLDAAIPDFTQTLENSFSKGIRDADTSGNWGPFFNTLDNSFKAGSSKFEGASRDNLKNMLNALGDQPEALQALAQTFLEAGQTIPENLSKGLTDINQMKALTGDVDSTYFMMGAQISSSPEYMSMIEKAMKAGIAVPEQLVNGIQVTSGLVYDETSNTFKKIEEGAENQLPAVLEYMKTVGPTAIDAVSQSFISQYGLVYDNGQWVAMAASDGLANGLPEALNAYSQSGVDIPDRLISSLSGKSSEVQSQAAYLINELRTATEAEKPGILAALQYLGIDSADELSNNLRNKQADVEEAARQLAILIGSATDDEREPLLEKMRSLGVDLSNEQIAALQSKYGDVDTETRKAAQNYINGFDETITANGNSSQTAVAGWTKGIFDSLLEGLDEHSPSVQTQDAAKNYLLGFNNTIDSGRNASNNIIKAWATGMYNTLDRFDLPGKAKRIGSNTGGDFNIGINSQRTAAYTAGRGLSLNAVSGINSVDSGAGWEWGYDLGSGLANGLWAAQWKAASAASSIASTIRSYLHFSRPDVGPLRDYETYMPDFIYGLTDTLKRSRPILISEVENTSDLIADAMKIQPDFDPQILSDAAASIDRNFMPKGEAILKLQYDNESSRQIEALSRDMAALRGELQALSKDVHNIAVNGINGDSMAQSVKEAIESADIKAVVDRRQAGQALTPEIDKNQGHAIAMKKRGV